MSPFCSNCDVEGVWNADYCFCPKCLRILAIRKGQWPTKKQLKSLQKEFVNTQETKEGVTNDERD